MSNFDILIFFQKNPNVCFSLFFLPLKSYVKLRQRIESEERSGESA
jgi:hypothetical protein